ncbi:MAG TPA: helix-turn-helix domain-containing protein [Nitrospiraceae bacterium]|jgi:hypothetical protein|nr:helix-turn-helix domain-containing protein [Nitrospiraceae bacterium]
MDQEQIQQWLASHGTPQQMALRSRIVLAASAGQSNSAIASHSAINRNRVLSWQNCFAEHGIENVWEGPPGHGGTPTFVWTATVEPIQKMHSSYRQTFEQAQPGCTPPDNSTAMKTLSS